MADARDCNREREIERESKTRIWFASMNKLSWSCEIFSVFCCRPRLKLLLNCHNLWRIMSKLVAVRAASNAHSASIRLPSEKASDTRSVLPWLPWHLIPPFLPLYCMWQVDEGQRRHKVCQPGSRDFEWRSPVYSLFAFQPTASIMLSITQLNRQSPSPPPRLPVPPSLPLSSSLAISDYVDWRLPSRILALQKRINKIFLQLCWQSDDIKGMQ